MNRIALSVRQPWATLLAHGIKTIEIRTWKRRPKQTTVYLHAGKLADDRLEGWELVPPDLREFSQQRGGIVARLQFVGIRLYPNQKAFATDCVLHRNQPGWYQPPVLYGIEFANPEIVPFEPMKGKLFFFSVNG